MDSSQTSSSRTTSQSQMPMSPARSQLQALRGDVQVLFRLAVKGVADFVAEDQGGVAEKYRQVLAQRLAVDVQILQLDDADQILADQQGKVQVYEPRSMPCISSASSAPPRWSMNSCVSATWATSGSSMPPGICFRRRSPHNEVPYRSSSKA